MTQIELRGVQKYLRRRAGHQGPQSYDRRQRVHRAARPVRLRQDDDAARHRRAGDDRRGRHPDRRQAGAAPEGVGPRHRHGVPVLLALPAHERLREHRLPAEGDAHEQERGRQGGARDRQSAAHHRPARQEAVGAVGRRHAARGDRPGAGAAAEGDADGRADRRARRQAARGDARRDQAPASEAGLDHDLRHPRPDRGDEPRRPHRHHA